MSVKQVRQTSMSPVFIVHVYTTLVLDKFIIYFFDDNKTRALYKHKQLPDDQSGNTMKGWHKEARWQRESLRCDIARPSHLLSFIKRL